MVSPDPNSPDRQASRGFLRWAPSGALTDDRTRAERLGLAVSETGPSHGGGLWLQRIDGRLSLCGLGRPFAVDFETGPLARRLRAAQKRDPLARAFGLHRHPPGRVLDATAGWLRDAATLAALGCEIVAVECNPVVHWLAEDGLERTRSPWRERLTLRIGNGQELLEAPPPSSRLWDAVYLDPMFDPSDTKAAAPGKDGQLLRALAHPGGADQDRALLTAARASTATRIVVKRHPGAPPLAAPPTFSVESQRTRFDVYLTK